MSDYDEDRVEEIYALLNSMFPQEFFKIKWSDQLIAEIEVKKLLDKYPNYLSKQDKKIFSGQIFCGSGDWTLLKIMALHKRLTYGLSYLSGQQQNGGMGSEYSEKEANQSQLAIDDVIEDIIVALGAHDRFKKVKL